MPNTSPVTAWKALKEGNERFVAGKPEHPSQSVEHRASLAAGQAIDSAVLGSIEYAVTVLDVPLIVVLGHSSCGAVKAAIGAIDDGAIPGGFVRDVVERVAPSILMGRRDGLSRVDEFEERHVCETLAQLVSRSSAIAERVDAGTLALAGVTYKLAEGRAALVDHIGDIGE